MGDVVSLQCGERVTRTAPARTEADVREFAECSPQDGQALASRGLQRARRAGRSSHVLNACRAGWLDAVSAGAAGLLKDAPHACHRVIGVFEPEPPSRVQRRGRCAEGICLVTADPPCGQESGLADRDELEEPHLKALRFELVAEGFLLSGEGIPGSLHSPATPLQHRSYREPRRCTGGQQVGGPIMTHERPVCDSSADRLLARPAEDPVEVEGTENQGKIRGSVLYLSSGPSVICKAGVNLSP